MAKINVVAELFKAEWCGPCNRFLPEWKKFIELTNIPNEKINFDVKTYELTKDKDLIEKVRKEKKYDYKTYPTLMLTICDNKPEKYEGNRIGQDILDHINKKISTQN